MATVMEMPKLSDTMKEGVVASWLKKEGDKVTAGAPVVEIETDKATMEFEAPAGGLLLKILVNNGGTCDLNAPIAVIGKEGESWQEALEKYNAKKAGQASKSPSAKPVQQKEATKELPKDSLKEPTTESEGMRLKASPLAKKIAADQKIDLTKIQGSGPSGRIVLRDLESTTTLQSSSPIAHSGSNVLAQDSQKISLTNMRKTIAKRLTESVLTNPHFYLTVSINMGNILSWRKETLSQMTEDKKFSVNDLLVFLVSRALKAHPTVNSSWQEDHILQHNNVHVGVAVALPNGLVTPVIKNSHTKSVLQISQEIKHFVTKAKDNKLQPEDYSNGTFTISNLGMNGIEHFTAIINPPQAAILAVGATIATPVVLANGTIAVEQRMKVTLSCDHRVIDGAVGSEFLKTLKQFIENPLTALFLS
jgi:pyruvate dehydrogenase E2 component (dihydrolipoamide acetyltransferase)